MSSKRILVTGAGGFTGHYLVERLAQDGFEVHGLAQDDQVEVGGLSGLHIANLNDRDELKRAVTDIAPTHVAHLAAISFVGHGNADDIYATNLIGTRNLLEALAGLDRAPESILLASSANIYGNQHEGRLDEQTLPAPANDYGVSKLAMEYLAGLYSSRLPITIVRPFNYTGVGQAKNFLIPKIVDHVRRKAPVIELGNLDVARDFSDVRMVVDVYARLLATPEAKGRTLNVCSGVAHSLRDVLAMAESVSGHTMDVRVNPDFVRSNEVKLLCGDNRALLSLIGPVSMPTLEDTLSWMIHA